MAADLTFKILNSGWVTGKYLIDSNHVHVFPSAFRGIIPPSAGSEGALPTPTIDPESRVQTEKNFSNLGGQSHNGENSYLITMPSGSSTGTAKFVIGGYYFELFDVNANVFQNNNKNIKYAAIKKIPYTLYDEGGSSSRLCNLIHDGSTRNETDPDFDSYLDENCANPGDTADYYFSGIIFSDELPVSQPEGTIWLQLFNNDSTVHVENKQIRTYNSLEELKDFEGKIDGIPCSNQEGESNITLVNILNEMEDYSILAASDIVVYNTNMSAYEVHYTEILEEYEEAGDNKPILLTIVKDDNNAIITANVNINIMALSEGQTHGNHATVYMHTAYKYSEGKWSITDPGFTLDGGDITPSN